MGASFLNLPNEIRLVVASLLDARDLASLRNTCRPLSQLLTPLLSSKGLLHAHYHRHASGPESPSGQGAARSSSSSSSYYTRVKHLLSFGTNPSLHRDDGEVSEPAPWYTSSSHTLLHHAVRNDCIPVVELLLGAAESLPLSVSRFVDTRDSRGRTALHCVVLYGKREIAHLLLSHRVCIDATDKTGWTALHYAARSGCTDIVAILLKEEGAFHLLEAGELWNETPLFDASTAEVAQMLLDAGAEVNVASKTGVSIQHVVAHHWDCDLEFYREEKRLRVMEVLKKHGGKLFGL